MDCIVCSDRLDVWEDFKSVSWLKVLSNLFLLIFIFYLFIIYLSEKIFVKIDSNRNFWYILLISR